MKVERTLSVVIVLCSVLYSTIVMGDPPSREQALKLAQAVYREEPHSLDITYYDEMTTPGESEAEVRQTIERAWEQMWGPKESLSASDREALERNIQLGVELNVKRTASARTSKCRIRTSGQYYYRSDVVVSEPRMTLLEGTDHETVVPEKVVGPNTPYEITVVLIGEEGTSGHARCQYFHKAKTGTISDGQGKVNTSKGFDFMRFPSNLVLKMLLGKKEQTASGTVYAPDDGKLKVLGETGKLGRTIISTGPDPNAPDTRDRIETRYEGTSHVAMAMVCDRGDYWRVHYVRINNPLTGAPAFTRQSSGFDEQGYPHEVTTVQYGLDGSLKEKDVYRIDRIEVNLSVPDEVFEDRPPGYKISDLRQK